MKIDLEIVLGLGPRKKPPVLAVMVAAIEGASKAATARLAIARILKIFDMVPVGN